jgi:hypothetical protein
VPEWSKGGDCKSPIRGFESHRRLFLASWAIRFSNRGPAKSFPIPCWIGNQNSGPFGAANQNRSDTDTRQSHHDPSLPPSRRYGGRHAESGQRQGGFAPSDDFGQSRDSVENAIERVNRSVSNRGREKLDRRHPDGENLSDLAVRTSIVTHRTEGLNGESKSPQRVRISQNQLFYPSPTGKKQVRQLK